VGAALKAAVSDKNVTRLFCVDCGERLPEHQIEYIAERDEFGHERVFFSALKRCLACRNRVGEKTIYDGIQNQ
jgi:hypothetical protein